VILQTSTPELTLSVERDHATLMFADRPVKTWPVTRIESLSSRRATEVAHDRGFLWIDRAAPRALEVLRQSARSFATRSGELHIVEPPGIVVVQPATRASSLSPSPARTLSKGSARVGRWLLLHPDAVKVTIGDLADACQSSDATASRTVAQLTERGLLGVTTGADARQRTVQVDDPAGLLDAIADEGPWRRARQTTWDVGAKTSEQALDTLRAAAMRVGLPYAVGGISGAAVVERLVEPTVATVWLRADDIDAWYRELLAEPARAAPGRITVRIAPDPVVLEWSTDHDGVRIADLVQLYVDCRHAGERAIDLADAMRRRLVAT
jgi:hypothetical protein